MEILIGLAVLSGLVILAVGLGGIGSELSAIKDEARLGREQQQRIANDLEWFREHMQKEEDKYNREG